MKLSKNTIPRAIASMATMHVTLEEPGSKNVSGALGSKAGEGGPSPKIIVGAKKATTSIKEYNVTIGALANISSEGTQESSPHG
jgi:hypothetical protein